MLNVFVSGHYSHLCPGHYFLYLFSCVNLNFFLELENTKKGPLVPPGMFQTLLIIDLLSKRPTWLPPLDFSSFFFFIWCVPCEGTWFLCRGAKKWKHSPDSTDFDCTSINHMTPLLSNLYQSDEIYSKKKSMKLLFCKMKVIVVNFSSDVLSIFLFCYFHMEITWSIFNNYWA